MKQARLICMIALAAAVAIGCGTEEFGSAAVNGSGPTGGTDGGTGGSGGTGGVREGACTTEENTAVYEGIDYSNDEGDHMGADAVAEIAADCVFGTAPNIISDGCGPEVSTVLGNNNPETQAALAACVVQCTVDQGVDLSADCLSCYGGSVTCGAANCAGPCAADTDAPLCVECRTENGCFSDFDECSGLP